MTRLQTRRVGLIVALAACIGAGGAWGGWREQQSVGVEMTHAFAFGSMGTAYNSADSNQYIGCVLMAQPVASGSWVSCSAQDKAGRAMSCYSNDPSFVQGFFAIRPDSKIEFYAKPDGTCQSLVVWNNSAQSVPKP